MKDIYQRINHFFSEYEAGFNQALKDTPDVERTASFFADTFIEANPFGVMAGKNDESFRQAIPIGYAFYRSIGTKGMKINSTDTTILDEFHAMTKIHWKSSYEAPDGRKTDIEFDVIYFLQILKTQIKIFGYITGDEQKVLREHGLIPDHFENPLENPPVEIPVPGEVSPK